MAVHRGKTFTGTVELDGNQYVQCRFEDCTLLYRGGQAPSFEGCSFAQFQFAFDGPAAATVAFLQAMAQPGSGLQRVVRDTFPTLRKLN